MSHLAANTSVADSQCKEHKWLPSGDLCTDSGHWSQKRSQGLNSHLSAVSRDAGSIMQQQQQQQSLPLTSPPCRILMESNASDLKATAGVNFWLVLSKFQRILVGPMAIVDGIPVKWGSALLPGGCMVGSEAGSRIFNSALISMNAAHQREKRLFKFKK